MKVPYLACAIALILAGGAVRAQQAATQSTPSAREIVDRFVRETGGQAAFKALKSIRGKGKLTFPSQKISGDVDIMLARPSKMLTRATVSGIGTLEEGFDGKIGWSINPLEGPSVLSGRALLERADEAWFDAGLHTPDFAREMTVVGQETFDKRPAYRLKVKLASGSEQEELFDVETGLQLGLEATRAFQMGTAPTTTIFRDYKKFGAVKMPTTQVLRVLGSEQLVTISSYEFNVVPSNAFDLPAAIKALLK